MDPQTFLVLQFVFACLLIFGGPFLLIGLVMFVAFQGANYQRERGRRLTSNPAPTADRRRGFEFEQDSKSESADESSAGQ